MSAHNNDERRHFWRAHFHSPVQVALHGEVVEAELHDISLKGALFAIPQDWPGKLGDHCQIRLVLGPETTISMHGAITHRGVEKIGLHCDNIDIDSVTHLRRLVELNAGDPSILDRELSALLHDAG